MGFSNDVKQIQFQKGDSVKMNTQIDGSKLGWGMFARQVAVPDTTVLIAESSNVKIGQVFYNTKNVLPAGAITSVSADGQITLDINTLVGGFTNDTVLLYAFDNGGTLDFGFKLTVDYTPGDPSTYPVDVEYPIAEIVTTLGMTQITQTDITDVRTSPDIISANIPDSSRFCPTLMRSADVSFANAITPSGAYVSTGNALDNLFKLDGTDQLASTRGLTNIIKRGYQFSGFNFDIPDAAVITGFRAVVAHESNSQNHNYYFDLWIGTTHIGSSPLPQTQTPETVEETGDFNDLMGTVGLTGLDIKDPNFSITVTMSGQSANSGSGGTRWVYFLPCYV